MFATKCSPTKDGAILNFRKLNWISGGRVSGLRFGYSDHNSSCFKVIMERNTVGPQVLVLNYEKADFNGIREDLAKIDWR